jgi:hypothetical protein
MPWRGPAEPGEFPTLGYDVGEWIESHLVVPDGYRAGQPYLLTDEMWTFLVHYYRLYPHAGAWPAPDALRFTGGQLRRSQKWGKDPFAAAMIAAEAQGPTRFDGWNAAGEPVGAPYPSPLIVCLGTSEEQTANTWRPLLAMLRGGALVDLPGMDIGETRVVLPSGGKIEPATTSARARLGAPMTFVTITETHLFTLQGGHRKVCGAVKRNVAGMDGRWLEMTNAWDPSEGSEAQVTGENPDERTYVDTVEPKRVEDLNDDEALYAELMRQYGDSARERGGWVNIRGRIFGEARSTKHMEADRRRFFLNEIVVGESVFVDPLRWDAMAAPEMLQPGDRITLGFDGSKTRDATALVAARMSDGKLFELRTWERPDACHPVAGAPDRGRRGVACHVRRLRRGADVRRPLQVAGLPGHLVRAVARQGRRVPDQRRAAHGQGDRAVHHGVRRRPAGQRWQRDARPTLQERRAGQRVAQESPAG